jgi:hypothetical protein
MGKAYNNRVRYLKPAHAFAGTINVNMSDFAAKWQRTEDNEDVGLAIRLNRGILTVTDTRPYEEELTAFGIHHTVWKI